MYDITGAACTIAVETKEEPITVESLWRIYTEAWIVPMTFKPTGETVYVTPQFCDGIEKFKKKYPIGDSTNDRP